MARWVSEVNKIVAVLPALLGEHERLERDSEAGRAFARGVSAALERDTLDAHIVENDVIEELAIYRSACEGEK